MLGFPLGVLVGGVVSTFRSQTGSKTVDPVLVRTSRV
ncbi:hypothetical protein SLEP1_g54308 [Rubroshorea leprosula]|uniref:Uncharacterized protein n=1 Tax=Rubroshorea leprosula TaxID=152421 RepID=A0AAV5MC55_9ROSI|nr:hypothetical protein SLEP1_g54308 [Rubroshorea leprosula]